MEVQEVLGKAQDAMTVRRVFGDPYEKNGVTIIPAASIGGGGGGGGGQGTEEGKEAVPDREWVSVSVHIPPVPS